MTTQEPTIDYRVLELENKVEQLEQTLRNMAGTLIGSVPAGDSTVVSTEKPISKKKRKEQRKAELLKDVPYTQKALKELKLKDLRMLASALNVNCFGMKSDQIFKEVVAAQKKHKKK